jgi:hypothetical protein
MWLQFAAEPGLPLNDLNGLTSLWRHNVNTMDNHRAAW